VDEEQGAVAHLAALFRRLEYLAQVRDAGEDRRERLESEVGARFGQFLGEKPGDRRLAAAGRAPQDHRGELAARHHSADRSLRAEQMLLADDDGEALRPQSVSQWVRRLALE